jgi:CPA1 family monovalent cation:H+ antiporter
MAKSCEHLAGLTVADFPAPRTPQGCEKCLREGTRWVQLRECRQCGHVGCCIRRQARDAAFPRNRAPGHALGYAWG